MNLLPAIVWEECAKVPELYHHFQLHHDHEPDHSFFDFLAEHYGSDSNHHTTHHDHAKIPFKAPHTNPDTGWNLVYLPAFSQWTSEVYFWGLINPHTGFHYAQASLPEPLLRFWQPPKL